MLSSFSAHLHNNDIDPKDRSRSKSGALGTIMFTFDLWRTTAKDISSQLPEASNTKTCFLTQCLNNVVVFSKTDFSVFGMDTITKKPGSVLQAENGVVLSLCQTYICKTSRTMVV